MRWLRPLSIVSFLVMTVASGLGACRDLRGEAERDRSVFSTEGEGAAPFGVPADPDPRRSRTQTTRSPLPSSPRT